MSFAYLALFTGDYLRDTRHLTPLRHGVYLLLLIHCWDQRGPLPLDEEECAGIACCRTDDERGALRYIIERYFVQMPDGYYNPRMQREIEKVEALSGKRRSAGIQGNHAKASQLRRKSNAIATQVPLSSSSSSSSSSSPSSGVDPSLSEVVTPLASPDKKPSGSAAVLIPLVGKKEWQVPLAYVAELEVAYPSVDGVATLREIRAWCVSNPDKCKTERGVRRFINRWFEKEHNRG